jgi:hypothetical protein
LETGEIEANGALEGLQLGARVQSRLVNHRQQRLSGHHLVLVQPVCVVLVRPKSIYTKILIYKNHKLLPNRTRNNKVRTQRSIELPFLIQTPRNGSSFMAYENGSTSSASSRSL